MRTSAVVSQLWRCIEASTPAAAAAAAVRAQTNATSSVDRALARGLFDDLLRHAAVEDVALAGRVRCLVAREPGDEGRDLLRLARPAERNFRVERLGVVFVARRRDHARRDGVDADVLLRELERHC